MLSPTQIQKLISNYAVADYEVRRYHHTSRISTSQRQHHSMTLYRVSPPARNDQTPISGEVLKAVAARVIANDKHDHLLLPPELEDCGPYEVPLPRQIEDLYTYIPAW